MTANPLARVATSAPVVSATVRAPGAAAGSMLRIAVALVGEFTVRDATVTPAPKFAWLVPCRKCVNWPVMMTGRFC